MQQIVREHQTYPPKIVASVTSWELWKTLKGKDLTDQCDWVELRVDALPPELTTEQVMEFRPEMPLLVTVRCHEEGGLRRIPEEERFALIRAYMPYATAMDIEIKAMRHARELIMEAGARDVIVIGSTHDFQITPGVDYLRELEKRRAPTRRTSSNSRSPRASPRTSRRACSFSPNPRGRLPSWAWDPWGPSPACFTPSSAPAWCTATWGKKRRRPASGTSPSSRKPSATSALFSADSGAFLSALS